MTKRAAASKKRGLRSPFVATVSALSTMLACTSQIVVDGESSGTGGSTSSGSTTDTTTSSSVGVGGTTTTTVGVGGSDGINCPTDMPNLYEACPDDGGHPGTCAYDVECQSGTRKIAFSCTPGSTWQLEPQACVEEHDSCPGTELYCSGEWWLPEATNPPSPCPTTAPEEFSECFWDGMGGVHQRCGYPCDDAGGWTVATCTGDFSNPGSWEYDGACAP